MVMARSHAALALLVCASALALARSARDAAPLRSRLEAAPRDAAPLRSQLTAPLPPPLPAPASTRLLPLGDSLTLGCGSSAGPANAWTAACPASAGGYRLPLWTALDAAGVNVTFVGTQSNGPAWAPAAAIAHEGHPGYTTREVLALLPRWAATAPTEVVVHLGTNDIGQNRTTAEAVADMAALLGNISAALPAARVFLCTIINMVNSAHPEWLPAVAAYNAALATLAAASPGVVLVDLAPSGLCPPDDSPSQQRLCSQCNAGAAPSCVANPATYDRVHPTTAGYGIMAGVIAANLLAHLAPAAQSPALG